MLKINNLKVNALDKEILKGIDLSIKENEIHVIMGKNGSGKSTLASSIMGDPKYNITDGTMTFFDEDLITMEVDERSKKGIFLGMQYPSELEGISNIQFLKNAINARLDDNNKIKLFDFYKEIENTTKILNVNEDYTKRFVNVGFSGGEKKKNEIFQMLLLKPKLIILDEIDSGLDVDATKVVGGAVKKYYEDSKDVSILIITHHNKILDYIKPDYVHIMEDGKIVKTGDLSLALKLEKEGFNKVNS